MNFEMISPKTGLSGVVLMPKCSMIERGVPEIGFYSFHLSISRICARPKNMRTLLFQFFLMAILTSWVVAGPEFRVNTYVDSVQNEPSIAMNGNGQYVVVWSSMLQDGSAEGIYGQRFAVGDRKVAGEFRVNTTVKNAQLKPAVAMNDAGAFVVVWSSYGDSSTMQDIYVKIFDGDGKPTGSEFRINTTTGGSQDNPSIAMDETGNFCVVWQSWFQEGGDRGVYGQRFNADGSRIGVEFLVNSTTKFSQGNPCVAMAPNGQFVVVWESWIQDGPSTFSYDVFGQRFDLDGSRKDTEFRVNTYTKNNQWFAKVAMTKLGDFVVVWTSWGQDGDGGGIFGQKYGAAGEIDGNEYQINTTTKEYQWLPSVAIDNSGSFVVVWSSWRQDGSREGVYGQNFDRFGRRLGPEFQVNTFTDNYQWEPGVARCDSSEVVVVWSSWGQDNNDYEVYAKRVKLVLTEAEYELGQIPERYELCQNYPNPFNPCTVIEFQITELRFVTLKVLDVLGREVKSLISSR
jgi:hypothetical protein